MARSVVNLNPGDKYWAAYDGEAYQAVVEDQDGKTVVRLLNMCLTDRKDPKYDYYTLAERAKGKSIVYKGLSVAAAGITGRVQTILSFWTLGDPPADAGKAKPAKEPKAKKELISKDPNAPQPAVSTIVRNLKKLKRQEGCAEGEERWYCNACADGFCATVGTTPEACPAGHPKTMDTNSGAKVASTNGSEPEGEPPTLEVPTTQEEELATV